MSAGISRTVFSTEYGHAELFSIGEGHVTVMGTSAELAAYARTLGPDPPLYEGSFGWVSPGVKIMRHFNYAV